MIIDKYLTEAQAVERYGYSKFWLQRRRHFKQKPDYLKRGNRIYYDIEMTDQWFSDSLVLQKCKDPEANESLLSHVFKRISKISLLP